MRGRFTEDGDGGDETNNDGFVGNEKFEEGEEVAPSPSIILGKRRAQGGRDKLKKPRVGTTLVIKESVTKISKSISSFTLKAW
jgi:hypothetical protein